MTLSSDGSSEFPMGDESGLGNALRLRRACCFPVSGAVRTQRPTSRADTVSLPSSSPS